MKWIYIRNAYELSFTSHELNEINEGTIYTVKTNKDELIVIRRME